MHWQQIPRSGFKTGIGMCVKLVNILFIVLALMGCSRIHEPWVSSDEQLRQERSRSLVQQDQLRDRLMTSQIDR